VQRDYRPLVQDSGQQPGVFQLPPTQHQLLLGHRVVLLLFDEHLQVKDTSTRLAGEVQLLARGHLYAELHVIVAMHAKYQYGTAEY
jgi:hypothetical protein